MFNWLDAGGLFCYTISDGKLTAKKEGSQVKKFTYRFKEGQLYESFKEMAEEEGKSMQQKFTEMVKKELNDRKVTFEAGQLIYLHKAAGLPLPPELREVQKELYDQETTEANKLAQELIQRKQQGEDLSEAEEDFLNSWMDKMSVGVSAEVGKPEGLEDE